MAGDSSTGPLGRDLSGTGAGDGRGLASCELPHAVRLTAMATPITATTEILRAMG